MQVTTKVMLIHRMIKLSLLHYIRKQLQLNKILSMRLLKLILNIRKLVKVLLEEKIRQRYKIRSSRKLPQQLLVLLLKEIYRFSLILPKSSKSICHKLCLNNRVQRLLHISIEMWLQKRQIILICKNKKHQLKNRQINSNKQYHRFNLLLKEIILLLETNSPGPEK